MIAVEITSVVQRDHGDGRLNGNVVNIPSAVKGDRGDGW